MVINEEEAVSNVRYLTFETASSSLITISLMDMSLSVMLREHSLLPNILQSVLRSVQHLS